VGQQKVNKATRDHTIRPEVIGSTNSSREESAAADRPAASTLNPKVAGSIPARPIANCLQMRASVGCDACKEWALGQYSVVDPPHQTREDPRYLELTRALRRFPSPKVRVGLTPRWAVGPGQVAAVSRQLRATQGEAAGLAHWRQPRPLQLGPAMRAGGQRGAEPSAHRNYGQVRTRLSRRPRRRSPDTTPKLLCYNGQLGEALESEHPPHGNWLTGGPTCYLVSC
jgi:hypothetical protein